MIFELTVLGSSSALPTSTKFPTAHVLNVHERFFLIDCGEGTQIQLRKAKIKFSRLHHIFISHLHGDHVYGLFGLFSTLNLLGRKSALHLYGPPSLENVVQFYFSNFVDKHNYKIEFHPISERKSQLIFEDKVVEVFAFPLKHRVTSFGYLFKEKRRPGNIKKTVISEYNLSIKQINEIKSGEDLQLENGKTIPNSHLTEAPYHRRSYAYCSDTSIYRKNINFLKEVDLMFHETTFLDRDKKLAKQTGHSTTKQAGSFARDAMAKQLLIGHFSNRYKDYEKFLVETMEVFKPTSVAEELKVYSVPVTRRGQ